MAESYDVTLTVSGTAYNFMLLKEGNEKRWRVSDQSLLPLTMITGEPTLSTLSPEKEIILGQSDWRKGFQDLLYEDPKRYYQSTCDARFKGKVVLPPAQASTLAYPTAPVSREIKNTGFETDVVNWTGTWIQNTDKHGGAYAAKVAYSPGVIYQDLPFSKGDRSKSFTLTAWCKVGTTGDTLTYKITIDDGVSSTSTNVTETTYTQKTVTRTLNAAATRLRIQYEYVSGHLGDPGDTDYGWIDDCAITRSTCTPGACAKFIEFNDVIVGTAGPVLFKIGASSITVLLEFEADITDLCIFRSGSPVTDRLYIALGLSNNFYYTPDLFTFTQSTLDNTTAKYMSTVADDFWISDTATTLRDSENPINGGSVFSSPYTIPNSAYNITGLVDHPTTVYIRKEDQVYYLSVSDVFRLVPELISGDKTRDYGLYSWKDNLYIPSSLNALYEYDDGLMTDLSPAVYAPGDIDFDTYIGSIASDYEYLYISVNETNAQLLAGHWETIDGTTEWVWHPLYEVTAITPTASIISNAGGLTKYWYLGTGTAGDGILRFKVPIAYSDVLSEGSYTVTASGDFITPWLTTNFPTLNKFWKDVDVIQITVTDKTQIVVSYQKKGDSSWASLGTCTKQALVDGAYPPEYKDNFDIQVTSERVRFKFALTSANTAYSPILYGLGGGYGVRAKLQSQHKRRLEFTILVQEDYRERNDSVIEDTISDMLTDLRTIYAATTPITLVGPDATSYTCIFDAEGYEEQLAYDEFLKKETYLVTLRLLEV